MEPVIDTSSAGVVLGIPWPAFRQQRRSFTEDRSSTTRNSSSALIRRTDDWSGAYMQSLSEPLSEDRRTIAGRGAERAAVNIDWGYRLGNMNRERHDAIVTDYHISSARWLGAEQAQYIIENELSDSESLDSLATYEIEELVQEIIAELKDSNTEAGDGSSTELSSCWTWESLPTVDECVA